MMDEQSNILATLFQQTWNSEPESRPNIHSFLILLKSALHKSQRKSGHQKKGHLTTYKTGTEVRREREQALDAASLRAQSLESSPRIHTSSPGSPSSPERLDDKQTSRRILYMYTLSALDNDSGVTEKSVRKIYNQKVTKMDTKPIKGWSEDLNLLLIVVSYSPYLRLYVKSN
jgi:hypothetical protein